MIHTIPTRAERHGIYFEPHELEPLGITEQSHCWGLWVEGRQIDVRARLDGKVRWLENETPHLLVSPIEPGLWPTAFNINVLIERRRFRQQAEPAQCDAFYGLVDALERCGVNLLFIQTAQVGYDLISVRAMCEYPRLRAAAAELVKRADEAGREMEKQRESISAAKLADEAMVEALSAQEDSAIRVRVAAFQDLGRILMPRLAELEARLLLIDHLRYCYWSAKFGASPSVVDEHNLLALGDEDDVFVLMVGRPPPSRALAESQRLRRDEFVKALSAAWFFNEKIVEVGENSYFLAYDSIGDRGAIRDARRKVAGEKWNDEDVLELSETALNTLYTRVLDILQNRPLRRHLRHLIPARTKKGGGEEQPRSGTAERANRIPSAADLERKANYDFFRRQALVPVTVSAVPSLAYARFWAFAGATGVRGRPIHFTYINKLLRPNYGSESARANRMRSITTFLSNVTRTNDDPLGPFDEHMAVFANMNLTDRFLRLRFARSRAEVASYLTIRLEYATSIRGEEPTRPLGLLRRFVGLALRRGFRVERVFNKITDADSQSESGALELNCKAIDQRGLDLCAEVAKDTDGSVVRSIQNEWAAELDGHAKSPSENGGTRYRVALALGVVPEGR